MMFLVPELHPINAPLWWLVSRAAEVRALYVHPACRGLLGRRLVALDVGQYLTSQEGWAIRDRAVALWSALLPRFSTVPWQVRYRRYRLDFSEKAKQDLARRFEEAVLLGEIQRRHQPAGSALIAASAFSAWLGARGCLPDPEAQTPRPLWLARLSVACDRVWGGCVNTIRILRLISWLIGGVVQRLSRSRDPIGRARYLYWCDGADDNNVAVDKRSCLWLADNRQIRSEDVLIVLPPGSRVEAGQRPPPSWRGQVASLPELYGGLPSATLGAALLEAIAWLVRCLCQPMPGVVRWLCLRYLTSVSQWRPIVDVLGPRCFLETDSSVGIEDPALVYFNQQGITTVMYHTSAMLPFARIGEREGRDPLYAHLLASRVVCWSRAAARFLASHPQHPRTQFEVLGPVLPGSEALLQLRPQELRRQYLNPTLSARAELKYVAAFDVAPLMRSVARSRHDHPYPEPFTEEATLAFLHDLMRLLSELPQVVLVYKPKRRHGLSVRFPTRLREYQDLVERLGRHERGLVLDADANPWIPLRMADLCVSMPGGSPPWAALHDGIPAFFHDPTSILRDPGDGEFWRYVTHDAADLVVQVRRLLDPTEGRRRAARLRASVMPDALGATPGANGNATLRTWLSWQCRPRECSTGSSAEALSSMVSEDPASVGVSASQ